MRHEKWYVLNQTQAIIEFDEEEFKIITRNRDEAFEYIQTFDDNNIVEYRSIVINVSNDVAKKRFDTVSRLYWITPQEIRIKWSQEDYIFNLARPLSKAWASRIAKILATIYFATPRFLTFYNADEANVLSDTFLNIATVNSIGWWLTDLNNLPINDVRNRQSLLEAQAIPASAVVNSMKEIIDVDEELGIVIWYGSPISYVMNRLRSTEATYRFFSENFAIEFSDTYESMEEYINDGIFVAWDWVIRSGWKLHIINEKGEEKELTDFDITVHYKIRRADSISYVVSLKKIDDEVSHIEWPTSFNETKICEFVSSFWPYHITASKANLNKIHNMISTSKVPDITVYYKYGKATYWSDKIIIFKDHVYNLDKKVAIPKMQDSEFYFIDGINGIKVEWNNATNINSMLVDKAPIMGQPTVHQFQEFLDITKDVFIDSSWEILLMTAAAWIGHSMFWEWLPCPMFFTTGITGSGKTTYAKFLCRLFWIEKPVSIEGTTPFPLRVSLTLLDELPLFLNEFRTKMPGAPEKTAILKALFDGTAFERGKPNQTLESYKFSAYVFMEGEELPESGATRSRSVIWKVKKSWQWKAIPETVLRDNRELLNSFCYSYFQLADRTTYNAALAEWQDEFFVPGIERRILTNIAVLYAWSVAVAPELADTFKRVCKELLKVQLDDFSRNGTIAEIINILSKYISSRYPKIYIDGYHIILPWDDIIWFVERARITTELKINTYRDHLEASGMEVGMFTVHPSDDDIMNVWQSIRIDAVRIPIASIDERLLGNPVVFKLYRDYHSIIKK